MLNAPTWAYLNRIRLGKWSQVNRTKGKGGNVCSRREVLSTVQATDTDTVKQTIWASWSPSAEKVPSKGQMEAAQIRVLNKTVYQLDVKLALYKP